MHTSPRLLTSVFILIAMALFGPGCSPEAKRAKLAAAADRYYAAGEFDKAEVEYLNILKAGKPDAHAISRLGLIYAQQGRLSIAIAYLVKANELLPEDLDVRVRLGLLAQSVGNLKSAREQAEYVLAHRPQDPEAPFLLALTLQQPEEAAHLRQVLQSLPAPAPAGAPVLTALGSIALQLNQPKEAEDLFKKALAADPKYATAYAALGSLYVNRRNPAADEMFKQAAEFSELRSNRRVAYARYKVATGDVPAGKQILQDLAQKAPDYLPAWISLAEITINEKKYDECATYLARVTSRDPNNVDALLASSRLKLLQGQIPEAVAVLENMVRLYPNMPVASFALGRAYLAAGDIDKAFERASYAAKLSPDFPDAVLLLADINIKKSDPLPAITLLRRLVQQWPDLIPANTMLADAYRRQGNFDEAVALYRKLEERQPANAELPLQRGTILAQQGKLIEARLAFDRAARFSPNNPSALEKLVDLDLAEKKFAAGRTRVEEALARNPKFSGFAELLLAKVAIARGDMVAAEAALKKSIAVTPDSPTAYFLLAGVYSQSNQIPNALANLEQAAAKNPKDPTPHLLTGMLQEQQNNFPAARDAYEKVLAANPNTGLALNNAAYIYSEKLNQLDKGYEMAQRARNVMPSDPRVADTLGWILYQKRQFFRALGLLQESAANQAEAAEVYYHLGMAQYMMGTESAARATLEHALKLADTFPGSDDARKSLEVLAIDANQPDAATLPRLEKINDERKGDPVALLRIAAIQEREKHSDQAIKTVEAALQASDRDRNVNALTRLAGLYFSQGDSAKALSLAKAAREIAPDDAVIAQSLGRLVYDSGDYVWAASLLQDSARKQSATPELLFDVARTAYSVGRVSDAEAALREAQQLASATPLVVFPHAREAREFLELIELAMNPTEAAKHAAEVEAALKADPKSAPALMASATISEQRGDMVAAREAYEKVLTRFPNFSPAKLRLALMGANQITFDQKTYDWALQSRSLYPGNTELIKALGILTYRKGDQARAIPLLKEAAAARSDDASVWYFLGQAQVQSKDLIAGRKSLQKSLELGLNAEMATDARKALDSAK